MGTPRKFSEKIALHKQRQDEEAAAFEKIMSEVRSAKVTPTTVDVPMPNNMRSSPVNVMPQQQHHQQQQQPQAQQQARAPSGPFGLHLNPNSLSNAFRGGGSLPNVNQMAGEKGSQRHLYGQSLSPRTSRNSIGPVRVGASRRTDHSPYAASPPNMSSMMMNHSMANAGGGGMCSQGYGVAANYLSPPPEGNWRRANSDSALNSLMIPLTVPGGGGGHGDSGGGSSGEDSSNNSNDIRDNYKNHDGSHSQINNLIQLPITVGDGPNLLEIPTSVSTGSLPDLSNFQFPPPLQQPIDLDENQQNHSPFSTSPLTGSSLTYSPTSMSPHPPSSSNNNQQQPNSPQQQQQQQQQQRNHQSQQQGNNVQINSSNQMMDNSIQMNSFQNFSPNDNMYRCPPRPSPQNSPSPFRSVSPLDGHLSGPSSPAGSQSSQAQQANQTPESFFLSQQAQALQQHFEHSLSMMETPERNNTQWQGGVAAGYNYYNQSQIPTGATAGGPNQPQQSSPQNPQTPQTPTSIPDIIFTDFSEVRGSDPGGLDEFFASEAAAAVLREGLGSIDMDGFQILAQSDLSLDPQVEDTFRLDRL